MGRQAGTWVLGYIANVPAYEPSSAPRDSPLVHEQTPHAGRPRTVRPLWSSLGLSPQRHQTPPPPPTTHHPQSQAQRLSQVLRLATPPFHLLPSSPSILITAIPLLLLGFLPTSTSTSSYPSYSPPLLLTPPHPSVSSLRFATLASSRPSFSSSLQLSHRPLATGASHHAVRHRPTAAPTDQPSLQATPLRPPSRRSTANNCREERSVTDSGNVDFSIRNFSLSSHSPRSCVAADCDSAISSPLPDHVTHDPPVSAPSNKQSSHPRHQA